jgi:hypothetical protein
MKKLSRMNLNGQMYIDAISQTSVRSLLLEFMPKFA